MADYEIRLRRNAQTSILRTVQANDFAAIACAREIATDSDSLEIWKGMECIFTEGPHETSLMQVTKSVRGTALN